MPLILPTELRNRLLARFESADARAFKLVNLIDVLKWSPDRWPAMFQETWEESADHQRKFLKGRLMQYAPWDEQDEEMVRQWLAFISDRTEAPPSGAREMYEFHQLIGSFYPRFINADDAEDPVETMLKLIGEVSQAIKEYGAIDETGELVTLSLNCIEVLSGFYAQRNDILNAVTQANVAVVKAEEAGRADRAMQNRCRSANLLFAGSRNIDEALMQVLPIWETVQDQQPSLDRANLAYTLARGYAQTGDLTETRYFFTAITEDLRAVGLGFDTDDPAAVLTSWLDALPPWEPKINYMFARFNAAALLHSQYATLREISVPLPEGKAFWRQRRERCISILGTLQALQQYQEKVDNQLIAGEPIPDFIPGSSEQLGGSAASFSDWLSSVRIRFGEDDQSEQLGKALYQKLKEDVVREDSINELLVWHLIGEYHTGRGEIEKSATALESAYRLATEANRLEEQLQTLELMVGTYLGPDHINERLEVSLRAIDLIEAARADISTPYQRSAFVQNKYEFYALALKMSWKTQDLNLMLGLMELVKANGYKDALLREGEEAGALKEELSTLHDERMSAAPESLPVIARKRQMLYDTRLLRARGQRSASDYRSASFNRIIESLPADEAVLNYCELIGGIWLVQLIAGGRLLAHEMRVEETWLHAHIASYSGDLPTGYRGRGMTTYKPKYGGVKRNVRLTKRKALAAWLLPDEFREALVGCRHLRICPHHELHAVPFQALPYEEGYLIEQFAVSYLPNLSCLPLEAGNDSKKDAPVVLIGTDQFAQFDGHGLAPLPGALAEVNEISAFYATENVSVLNFTGDAARRGKILDPVAVQAMEACRVVHLAVHGEDLSSESPMDARLFLRDGFLDGFDISLLHLTAEVVVLSACFAGARPQAVRGFEELVADDMYGLQSAFFSAGAGSVLGALWPVDDEAGKLLMVDFHRHLREHGAAEALRQATLTYLRTAPEGRRGSVFWGGFFLVVG